MNAIQFPARGFTFHFISVCMPRVIIVWSSFGLSGICENINASLEGTRSIRLRPSPGPITNRACARACASTAFLATV